MWSVIGRRVLDFAVGFFALLGFVLVPLGQRTALEHVKAIFTTEPAMEAGQELVEAGDRLRRRTLGGAGPSRGSAPSPSASASAEPNGPRPEPPSLAHLGPGDAGADVSQPWPDPG